MNAYQDNKVGKHKTHHNVNVLLAVRHLGNSNRGQKNDD